MSLHSPASVCLLQIIYYHRLLGVLKPGFIHVISARFNVRERVLSAHFGGFLRSLEKIDTSLRLRSSVSNMCCLDPRVQVDLLEGGHLNFILF